MPLPPRARAVAAVSNHTRRVAPRCRGGASSLLRLANPMPQRLPTGREIGDWVQRAADVLGASSFGPARR